MMRSGINKVTLLANDLSFFITHYGFPRTPPALIRINMRYAAAQRGIMYSNYKGVR
jgi:hypothetical protein